MDKDIKTIDKFKVVCIGGDYEGMLVIELENGEKYRAFEMDFLYTADGSIYAYSFEGLINFIPAK